MNSLIDKYNEIVKDLSRRHPRHDREWYEQNAYLIDYEAIRNGTLRISDAAQQLIEGIEAQFKENIKDAQLSITSQLIGDSRKPGGFRNISDWFDVTVMGDIPNAFETWTKFTLALGPYRHEFVVADERYWSGDADSYYLPYHAVGEVDSAKTNVADQHDVETRRFEEFATPGYQVFDNEQATQMQQSVVKERVLLMFEQAAKSDERYAEFAALLDRDDAITALALENSSQKLAAQHGSPHDWMELLHVANQREYNWLNSNIRERAKLILRDDGAQAVIDFMNSIGRQHAWTESTWNVYESAQQRVQEQEQEQAAYSQSQS